MHSETTEFALIFSARINILQRAVAKGNSVCPSVRICSSVCPFITLMIHFQTVQDIDTHSHGTTYQHVYKQRSTSVGVLSLTWIVTSHEPCCGQ